MRASHDPKIPIKFLVFMGDSLSDRSTFKKRSILYGFIPNNYIVDLSKSPHGRFTNGFTWDDYLCESLVNRHLSRTISGKLHLDKTELSDAVINHDPKVAAYIQSETPLSDDTKVKFMGERMARTFCEGGLSAHNYYHEWTIYPSLWIARDIVATLEQKRELLLKHDAKLAIDNKEKAETLVLEWSGGNDFITVNSEPTQREADLAVAARIENIKKLYESGYRNFALMNLPDLATTPRFQRKTEQDRQNATKVCNYFNDKLAAECAKLAASNPQMHINVFDVNSMMKDIYDHPEAHGFEKELLKNPYLESIEYQQTKEHTSPALGYLFWDDIHPTANAHAAIATKLIEQFEKVYHFSAPPPTHATDARKMYEKFMALYHHKVSNEKESAWTLYGRTMYTMMPDKVRDSLPTLEGEKDFIAVLARILQHALNENGERSRKILLQMEWIDANNNIDVTNPVLAAAKKYMDNYLVAATKKM